MDMREVCCSICSSITSTAMQTTLLTHSQDCLTKPTVTGIISDRPSQMTITTGTYGTKSLDSRRVQGQDEGLPGEGTWHPPKILTAS